jgi:hypothetical protein
MAKSDSFFIRAELDIGASFSQTSIDLGAYVDALGKSVLRVHNVQVQYTNTNNIIDPITNVSAAGANGLVRWQLTTQSQSDVQVSTERSLISSGSLSIGADAQVVRNYFESMDVNLQEWRNGYLIGVEQIYLGGKKGGSVDDTTVAVVMECTVETLSQSAAMALALSQQ